MDMCIYVCSYVCMCLLRPSIVNIYMSLALLSAAKNTNMSCIVCLSRLCLLYLVL